MGKIKFMRYDMEFSNHKYCVLIPSDIEQLFVYNFEGDEGTGWIGNRKAIKAIMYASAVLGFNPTDKIIYFPLRKNMRPKRLEEVDDNDLVLTTHQVSLKRSDWKEIRATLKYKKSKTYTLDYDQERTEVYFRKNIEAWENITTQRQKEYLIETVQENTLFQVFSRTQFQLIYLGLSEFLKQNLEGELWRGLKDGYCEVPFKYMDLKWKNVWYRKKRQMEFYPFVDFYDEEIEKRKKRNVQYA